MERPPEARTAEKEFARVMTFLDKHGVKLSRGWEDDAEAVYHGGHNEAMFAEIYGREMGTPESPEAAYQRGREDQLREAVEALREMTDSQIGRVIPEGAYVGDTPSSFADFLDPWPNVPSRWYAVEGFRDVLNRAEAAEARAESLEEALREWVDARRVYRGLDMHSAGLSDAVHRCIDAEKAARAVLDRSAPTGGNDG